MEILGTIHCFFEQSGTFKNEFRKLGYSSFDYDIDNKFGETDYVIDLFDQIECAFSNKHSIFDNIIPEDDLIIAFFPCIYFSCLSQMAFRLSYRNYSKLSTFDSLLAIMERSNKREYFFQILLKFICVCLDKNIRLIIENPWSLDSFLKSQIKKPDLIDNNRMLRGDYFVKPTAYWFWNCSPTFGESFQFDKKKISCMNLSKSPVPGKCSIPRSLISSDYARNFINDFILGKSLHSLNSLFEI